MKFNIITLFPEMFEGPLSESILRRAQEKKLIEINYHNLRDFATDKHKSVDDTPYGGGKGMLIKVDVVDKALKSLRTPNSRLRTSRILLTPQGERLNQDKVRDLAENYDELILIAGHYEGFDQRIRENLVDEEISIGDFVLTGGELPAMILVDAVARMVPGVLSAGSSDEETFMQKDEDGEYLKEYPQYTKPASYNCLEVPDILKSGNHEEIKKWRERRRK